MWVHDVQKGKSRSWRSAELLCPADDIDTQPKSSLTCRRQGDPSAMVIRRLADA